MSILQEILQIEENEKTVKFSILGKFFQSNQILINTLENASNSINIGNHSPSIGRFHVPYRNLCYKNLKEIF